MTFRLGNREVTIEDGRRYLRLYRKGYYPPARASNVEADARAYRLFEGGLGREIPALARQLAFIGKEFGGAKVVSFERVSLAIAERILTTDGYHDVLAGQPSLERGNVSAERLLGPFINLPPDFGRKRNFIVWASKVLHFSRPDAFPVLDSHALAVLGLPASIRSQYPDYVTRYRPTFLEALDDLRAAADHDPESPTLLRRFDKILYQLGFDLRN